MKKTKENILRIALLLMILFPAFQGCVDPLGIDDNVIRNEIKFDTTIVTDTIRLVDSIYFVRIDTVLKYNDSIIVKRDTIYMPIEKTNAYQITKAKVLVNEIQFFGTDKYDYNIFPWGYYEGMVLIEADTSFTSPIINVRMDIRNPYNSFVQNSINRKEIATALKVKVMGFVPTGPPAYLRGNPGENLSAEIELTKNDHSTRYIRSNVDGFAIATMDYRFNGNRLDELTLLIKGTYQSDGMEHSVEILLDLKLN